MAITEASLAQLGVQTPEEQAIGIFERYERFVAGQEMIFFAYFPYQVALDPDEPESSYYQDRVVDHRAIERTFMRFVGVDIEQLPPSEEAIQVDSRGDVTLYRWSNIFSDENGSQVFDAIYHACRGEELPIQRSR